MRTFYEFMTKKKPDLLYGKSIPQELLCNAGTGGKMLKKWVEIDGPIYMLMDSLINFFNYAI